MEDLKAELIKQLSQIPGFVHKPWPDRTDGFSTIHYKDREVGHFHHANELDLRLGKALIRQEGLTHFSDSTRHPNRSPGSPYIELRFKQAADLKAVVRLVQLLVDNSNASR